MTDNLRDRIINAIWDDLIVQRDSGMPFSPSVSRTDSYIDGEVDIESVADAVIRELGNVVNDNGVWGVIDLLIEIAGPRAFADTTKGHR